VNVDVLLDNWCGLSTERRREALHNLINLIIDNDPDDVGLEELLIHARNLEEEDFFGTEGARL
jgi:hypothetical protein